MNIQNKVVIITGASQGIGMEAAKLLSNHGAKIVLAARSKDAIEKLASELPDSIAIETDMTDADAIKNMIAKTKEHFGRVDILINNAGQGLYGPIEVVPVEDYKNIIELNVIGPYIAMQQVIPLMREQGGGMIINISSDLSKRYLPYLGTYASTKYALNCLSLTAREELKDDNIIVSIVLPTLTATNFGKNAIKPPQNANMKPRDISMLPEADSAEHVAEKILETIETEVPEMSVREWTGK